MRLHADVYVFWQSFSVSHGVHFLILSFSGMVSAAVSLQANSKWLVFCVSTVHILIKTQLHNLHRYCASLVGKF